MDGERRAVVTVVDGSPQFCQNGNRDSQGDVPLRSMKKVLILLGSVFLAIIVIVAGLIAFVSDRSV